MELRKSLNALIPAVSSAMHLQPSNDRASRIPSRVSEGESCFSSSRRRSCLWEVIDPAPLLAASPLLSAEILRRFTRGPGTPALPILVAWNASRDALLDFLLQTSDKILG